MCMLQTHLCLQQEHFELGDIQHQWNNYFLIWTTWRTSDVVKGSHFPGMFVQCRHPAWWSKEVWQVGSSWQMYRTDRLIELCSVSLDWFPCVTTSEKWCILSTTASELKPGQHSLYSNWAMGWMHEDSWFDSCHGWKIYLWYKTFADVVVLLGYDTVQYCRKDTTFRDILSIPSQYGIERITRNVVSFLQYYTTS